MQELDVGPSISGGDEAHITLEAFHILISVFSSEIPGTPGLSPWARAQESKPVSFPTCTP